MAQFQTALRYADYLTPEQRAQLLDEAYYESYLTEHMEEAIAFCAAALTLWRALDRTEQIGRDLRLLATYHFVIGKHADFAQFAHSWRHWARSASFVSMKLGKGLAATSRPRGCTKWGRERALWQHMLRSG